MIHALPTRRHAALLLLCVLSICLLSACNRNGPDPMAENAGVKLTTKPDQYLRTSMFIGKWDVDGKRTNLANGAAGIGTVPDNFWKDMTGKTWKFEEGGILYTSGTFSKKRGSWRLKGKDRLVVMEYGAPVEVSYETLFRDGYMYLKRPNGAWIVFERSGLF